MCNNLHTNSGEIAEEGFGWKLFDVSRPTKGRKGKLYPIVATYQYPSDQPIAYQYDAEDSPWVSWWSSQQERGFCFFLSHKEGRRLQRLWNWPTTLRKIRYEKGLGEHEERNIIGGEVFKIALCRTFRLAKRGEK